MQILLDQMGFSSPFCGYKMLADAIAIAVKDDEAVTRITQLIYPQVAEKFQSNARNVEKNMRKAIENFWDHGNRDVYTHIAGHKVYYRPTNAEFIAAVSSFILRQNERR